MRRCTWVKGSSLAPTKKFTRTCGEESDNKTNALVSGFVREEAVVGG